ncbi:hypothetical protein HAX54_044180, partial [Datura stramonium]|nr:hypothetical protein [Datura stramonium]
LWFGRPLRSETVVMVGVPVMNLGSNRWNHRSERPNPVSRSAVTFVELVLAK